MLLPTTYICVRHNSRIEQQDEKAVDEEASAATDSPPVSAILVTNSPLSSTTSQCVSYFYSFAGNLNNVIHRINNVMEDQCISNASNNNDGISVNSN